MASLEGYTGVEVELPDSGVVVATPNRPDRLNSFNGAMRQDIHRVLGEVTANNDARALVMTGCEAGVLCENFKEGLAVFKERREPQFKGLLTVELPKLRGSIPVVSVTAEVCEPFGSPLPSPP